jgi:hypothetical protein
MIFSFHCDESYDAPKEAGMREKTFVVAGFFSDQRTWEIIGNGWDDINRRFGVRRFHASNLNAKRREYEGWNDERKINYSKELLGLLNEQGRRLHAVSCGIYADEYRRIINQDGQTKFGSPYLVCFKTCIALIASEMESNFPTEDKFSVLLDKNPLDAEAVHIFDSLRGNVSFRQRSRLERCVPVNMDDCPSLQPSDLIAYEIFRRLHDRRTQESEMRVVLAQMFERNVVSERFYGIKTLMNLKTGIESAQCGRNELVVIPTE